MNKLQAAEQLRRAIQLFAQSLDDDAALEIATVYPVWQSGKVYAQGAILAHGEDAVGDPQLYRVVQGHASQADWLPADNPALYTPIGLTPGGYPIWSPPTGAHDAYKIGDTVSHQGKVYVSLIDGNTTEPGSDDRWWQLVEG